MSVDVPKVEETTPVATKPVEAITIPEDTTLGTLEPVSDEPKTTTGPADTIAAATEAPKEEAVVEATPATEGVLGYKAPGLLKQFRFVKHFFWFNEEPSTQDSLDGYVKNEKAEVAHHHAAWAQETGKGVLFYAKRAEDKNVPAGLILLAEAGNVTKIGQTDFSFKVGHNTHKFEAASEAERDSWVVAIQKIVEESKDLKTDVTGRESYKKNLSGYSSSPIVAGAAAGAASSSATPKKSLDATTATDAAVKKEIEPVKADVSSASSADESRQQKEAEKQAKKERSQSRKRNSVFGLFGKKDEEAAHKKAEKEHEKEVKKAEKEHVKEEKKVEAEHKKEEAKAEHDASKAKEAAEAAAIAAAPAAVVAAEHKKEEDKKEEKPLEEVASPTEKKSMRTSVFGGIFGKNKITSPSAEKSEKEVVPEVPAHDETPVVSETAPKLEEPIDTKPIDAAAVTAPVDHVEPTIAPVPAAEEPKVAETGVTHDSTAAATTPKTEKKSFVAGLFKKGEKKEELNHSKTNEDAVKETPALASEPAVPATEASAIEATPKETETAKEERPAREKRRTSLFGSLGTLKRKTEKSPAPESALVADDEKSSEVKREKSPLPSKIGGLFRKPSKANHIQTAADSKTGATEAKPETALASAAEHETPANATIVEPNTDSKIVGDFVPDELHSTVHDAVTQEPAEVKATA